MRVLHLGTLYPPHVVGGAERSVATLAETQVQMGMTVAAACIERTPEPKTDRNGVTVYRMPHENPFWTEDWPSHNKLERFYSKARQPYNRALEARFGEVLDDFKPDLVHTHSMVDVSTLVWRAADLRGIPIVHTLRDYDLVCTNSAKFHRGKTCERWHLRCRAMTYGKLLQQKRVTAVAAVGRQILDDHIAHGYFHHIPESMRRVIWNSAVIEGAEPGYVRPSRAGKPFTFGYLGRIDMSKGVGTLIQACRDLGGENWNLVVAGKPMNTLEPFERLASGLPIDFIGFVQPKTLFEMIDVLIVPSIWAEPMGRIIVESYIMGVPVLGSRVGGIPDLIGADNADWLFPPDDHVELTRKMRAILAAGRDALPTATAFDYVLSETTPEVVAARYGALYDDALRTKAGG